MRAECDIVGIESAAARASKKLMRRGRTLVGLGKLRHTAERPERSLQTALERQGRFRATRDRPTPSWNRAGPSGRAGGETLRRRWSQGVRWRGSSRSECTRPAGGLGRRTPPWVAHAGAASRPRGVGRCAAPYRPPDRRPAWFAQARGARRAPLASTSGLVSSHFTASGQIALSGSGRVRHWCGRTRASGPDWAVTYRRAVSRCMPAFIAACVSKPLDWYSFIRRWYCCSVIIGPAKRSELTALADQRPPETAKNGGF